jgi:cell division protein FtsN
MALTPRQAATLFFGTSLFGLLTFTSGLMIGVGIGGIPALPQLPEATGLPLAGSPPAASPQPASGQGTTSQPTARQAATSERAGLQTMAAASPAASGPVVVLPMPKPAQAVPGTSPATAPSVATNAAAPGSTTMPAAATGPAPLAVKDFRVGLPLTVAPSSPLRGPLVDAALAAPRLLTVAPPSPAAPGAAAGEPGTPPAAAPPAMPPSAPAVAAVAATAPPFVYSVQAGSFLVKDNAERLAAELNERGYAAQVLVAQQPGEPAWYPVVLAPVHDVETVARLAQEFSASEGRNAEVVSWLAAK